MNKPIGVGDLVMVVRACCDVRIGVIFKVEAIQHTPYEAVCAHCRADIPVNVLAAKNVTERKGALIGWLKRLDPDALKDDVLTKEDLTA